MKTSTDYGRETIAVAAAFRGHVFALRAPRGTKTPKLASGIFGLQDCAAELIGTSIPVSSLPTLFKKADDPNFKPLFPDLPTLPPIRE